VFAGTAKRARSAAGVSTAHFRVLLCLAGITLAVWAGSDRTLDVPAWRDRIDGFAYSPMQPGQQPDQDEFPTETELAADLARISEMSGSIRTYSIDGTLAAIPRLAQDVGLDVTAGIWLGPSRGANERRLRQLAGIAAANSNVVGAIIGNETQLREALPFEELTALLDLARDSLDVPVSTAEPWHIWLARPELAAHVDYLTVHLLPYWEGFDAETAIEVVEQRMNALSQAFPGLPIVIGEVGWPSNGRSRDAAVASRPDAETFLRLYLNAAQIHGYDYFLMEAVDQPWKQSIEGTVGAHWGWLDAARRPKYRLDSQLHVMPEWPLYAVAAMLLFMLGYRLLLVDAPAMRPRGLWLLGLTVALLANASVAAVVDQIPRYWTLGSGIAALLLGLGVVSMVAVIFVEVREWAEARFGARRRVPAPPPQTVARRPKVSIHVPTYAEPPAMVIATLEALARLDYPSFEVIVVDNNTADPDLWQPVAEHCRRLGERFRFYHVAPLAGYKAGALNFALARTAQDADIIAVLDSDYCVDARWLAATVHHFSDPAVAIVQARQDYRDGDLGTFKRMCEAEYRGFFDIGMVTRNDRNAIIQHGTMTLVRKRVLREVGAWAEWTVTEDAELGLRILAAGYDALYLRASYGRGLTPDSFRDYRGQRHRWALGAVQILRRHARMLLGRAPSELTFVQRLQFLTGWLPWLGDGLNLVFNLLAVVWSGLMILYPLRFNPPLAILSGFVLAAFSFKLLKTVCLYRWHVGATWRDTVYACCAGLALIHVVGRAVLAGIFAETAPFFRTPKLARPGSWLSAALSVGAESALAAGLLASAFGVAVTAPFSSPDRSLWVWLLVASALPHMSAVVVALTAAARAPSERRLPLLADAHRAERL
jgi:exo-beta-1,3-glucanase (GH17 family)/cellulose synthase/poly-beta-1,6-N-acetylglucosamine synthase-like glycosyltransferase